MSSKEGELQSQLYKLRQKLKQLYKKKLEGKLEKTHLIKETRKEIARILTKINQLKHGKKDT